ncbi:MAG TPA: ABC transporter permease [Ignavibacteria bacterium]
MSNFFLKHILHSISIILGVISLSFVLIYLVPGDPVKLVLGQRADEKTVEIVRKEMGLDKPIYSRYFDYIFKTMKGDLGVSYITNRNVLLTILEKFPATALLSFFAISISALFGIIIGLFAAIKVHSKFDSGSIIFALIGISIPQFVLGLLIAFIFGSILNWFPVTGYISDGWQYMVLPMVTLSLRPMAIIARITRSSVIEVMSFDFVRTAKAKGLSKMKIIFKHILRNSLNPVITTLSASLAATLGGVFFIEYIFNWPGIGLLAIDSVIKLDFPMVQGTVLFSAVIFVFINFIVDIIYSVLDPKVKLT